jgi:hypothetical protein
MGCRYLIILLLALTGCASAPPERLKISAGYCEPPLPYRYNPAFRPMTHLDAALTPGLLAHYPRRNLLTANAVGILPALQKLVTLRAASGQPPNLANEIAILKQRQLVFTQVTLMSSTVSSLAAELDCEGERADQMAGYLASLDSSRTQRLNVLSIVIGALSGIGTTVSQNRNTQYAFGVGGGLTAAGLGLLTLNQNTYTDDFQHSRNLLTDVWEEKPDSNIWPPGIWYMLTNPAFSNQGETNIAHNTRQRWQHYGQLARPESEKGQALTALLFGPGGHYAADQLTVRANMLNEMQSSVRLLNQEILGLLLVLSEDE